MPTLADLAGAPENMSAYRQYSLACMEAGRTPLSYEAWVKAGKPAA